MIKTSKCNMQKSGNPVAVLFEQTSPYAVASPDAGQDELARFPCSTIAARGVFHLTGRQLGARRGPGVVCCTSNASGNRRTAPKSSDETNGIPITGSRQHKNGKCDRIETCALHACTFDASLTVSRAALSRYMPPSRAHLLRSNETPASADVDACRPAECPFART